MDEETKRRVWAAIRSKLTAMRSRMELACSGSYEMELAYFDSIASHLADAAIAAMQPTVETPQ